MYSSNDIVARVRMEERYGGLSLIFGSDYECKMKILTVLDEVKEETQQTPFVCDKILKDRPECQSIYLEFHDDTHREAGAFFTKILQKLEIEKCEIT